MGEILLTGIPGDTPIGAMAAFGVLRLCEEKLGFAGPRLGWRRAGGSWRPLLVLSEDLQAEGLAARLASSLTDCGERHDLRWTEQVKATPGPALHDCAESAAEDELRWLCSFGCELVLDEGKLRPTPFDMSVARQKFPADIRKLTEGLRDDEDAINEALFGPWRYEDDQHSLGWDPSTVKLGAFTEEAPTKMKNTGVRAAVWLAYESLPLFPCFYADGGLGVRGFKRGKRNRYEFRWPVWQTPITLRTLRSLLASAELMSEAEELGPILERGVAAVYASEKFKPNKYMVSFRPAELLAEAAA
ncbi:MAG: hypothetical protein U0Q16_37555 [Bryobacteraceae bacterium]